MASKYVNIPPFATTAFVSQTYNQQASNLASTGNGGVTGSIGNANVSSVDASKITTGLLPVSRGGTGGSSFPNQRVLFGSSASTIMSDPNFIYDSPNQRLTVGGSGTARIGSVVTSGSTVALQAFTQGTNNAVQVRNENAYAISLSTRSPTNAPAIGGERGRGTQTTPTQSLSGDNMLVIVGNGYTGTQTSPGFGCNLTFQQSENCTATANGGEISFGTAINGTNTTIERIRIKNGGETIFQYAMQAARYTTSEKLALVASTGWVVFDTDLAKLSYFNGTTWVNI